MVQRCTNPNNPKYTYYSERGLCPTLRQYEGFYAVVGERPENMNSIDRIDSSRGYFPDNIRWSNPVEQSRNRSFARKIAYEGEFYTLTELAECSPFSNLSAGAIGKRLKRGWSIEKAIDTPPRVLDRAPYTKHGMKGTAEYRCLVSAKSRCHNPSNPDFQRYGGSGITVCELWRNDAHAFFEHMGPMPEGTNSLDRIDSTKGYEPNNCRWSEPLEQSRNRQSNVYVIYQRQSKTIAEWSELTGIPYHTLQKRLNKKHWTVEDALESPVKAPPRLYDFEGKQLNLKEIAGSVDIKYTTLYKRVVLKGQPLSEAIAEPVEPQTFLHKCKRRTLKEIAVLEGVSYSYVAARAQKGKGFDFTPKRNRTYEFQGKQLTCKEIANRTKVPYQTIIGRLNRGLTITEAAKKKRY
ncbi:hypothetical protein BCT07_08700 [Vibrio breoganii]|nr:hypothetical protein BCT07_08700 [Vibrio breoganii]